MPLPSRVLVTGAAGYIGRHLLKQLSHRGVTVRGFSRRTSPVIPGLADWYQGDITNPLEVRQAAAGCEAIVHLACLPLGAGRKNPAEAFQVNGNGTLNVLQAASELGQLQVVYASTGQVYAPSNRLPLREYDPTQSDSPYAAAKLCGEIMAHSFATELGLPVTTLRLFNVYGQPADGSQRATVENIFLKRLLAGQAPVIKGNPAEGRDFIHIDDVCQAFCLALEQPTVGEVINIGGGVLTTLLELAQHLIHLTHSSLEPVVEASDKAPVQFQADITRAKHLLGFQPQISVEAGLAHLLKEVK